jgi:hypothetical protein
MDVLVATEISPDVFGEGAEEFQEIFNNLLLEVGSDNMENFNVSRKGHPYPASRNL